MTYEDKLELIQSYIHDIETYTGDPSLSTNEKQHVKRALEVYNGMYHDIERGKLDPDTVHESITSFLYMIQ